MSRRRLHLVPITVVLLSALAGCGDDDDDVASDDASSRTSAGTTDVAAGTTESAGTAAVAGTTAVAGTAGATTVVEGRELPDACSLLEPGELEPLVGMVEPEVENGVAIDGLAYTQCTWETEETLLIVGAVEGRARYEAHLDNLGGEPLDGVGDAALMATGVSSETKGASGGRTVSALVGGHTVLVALRLTGETTRDDIVPLAEAVATRAAG